MQLKIGDVVEWAEECVSNKRYEPGPYLVIETWPESGEVKLAKMDGSPLCYDFNTGDRSMLHVGMTHTWLRKLEFLSAVRARRHG